jgi:uncharacterized protein (TIGR02058 family)
MFQGTISLKENKKHLRRFILEFGMGIDQHGQNATRAACKAVSDAVSRSCLVGLIEIVRLRNLDDMLVDIQIACPHPEQVDRQEVMQALPFGQKQLEIREGGMLVHGLYQPELGDTSDEAYIANAAITVWIDEERMLQTWREEHPN